MGQGLSGVRGSGARGLGQGLGSGAWVRGLGSGVWVGGLGRGLGSRVRGLGQGSGAWVAAGSVATTRRAPVTMARESLVLNSRCHA